MTKALTIGRLARATGVPAKTIRYYEQVGVLPAPRRTAGGYRQYATGGIQRVLFVRRARALGLSLRQLKTLGAALDGGARLTLRPRLMALVRAQLSAVQRQATELGLLQRQLEAVLHRLSKPAPVDRSEGCRCLENEDDPATAGPG